MDWILLIISLGVNCVLAVYIGHLKRKALRDSVDYALQRTKRWNHPLGSVQLHGDSTVCTWCSKMWDTNDPNPPDCKYESQRIPTYDIDLRVGECITCKRPTYMAPDKPPIECHACQVVSKYENLP